MLRFPESIATRLALGYALLLAACVTLLSVEFYVATVGVLESEIDSKLEALVEYLDDNFAGRPPAELDVAIDSQLRDGLDSDSEILLVLAPDGSRRSGNLPVWTAPVEPQDTLQTQGLRRGNQNVQVRYIVRELPDGRLLVVGSDMQAQQAVRSLVLRALTAGGLVAMVLTPLAALFFRWQLETRIGQIRHAARDIELGDLARRIPISGNDEFERLGMDINRMLDRIEHLMDGVRHVSNSIAHDLRTPLNRIRGRLEESLRHGDSAQRLQEAAEAAIEDIDDLILLFNKLLQIAEVESGMRTQSFESVRTNDIVRDMVELYDASAEEQQTELLLGELRAEALRGDHDMVASALANLIDNALKHAGPGGRVEVSSHDEGEFVCIEVRDHGPGIPEEELPRVTDRFYRLDHSRSQPGSGLGLSIVQAIATLHEGRLELLNTNPGLCARLLLPRLATGQA